MAKKKIKKAKQKKAIKEPWVEIKGIVHDPSKGLKIELDWNPAFVEKLRSEGYTGTNDEAVIQRWLAILYKDLVDKMGEGKTNEYE